MKKNEVERFTFDEVFGENPTCERQTELFRYFEGRLPADAEKTYHQHLAGCSTCAGRLAELQLEQKATEGLSLDPEQTKRIFNANRVRLTAALDVKYPGEQRVNFWQSFRLPAYANAMLMIVIAVLIYPAYRSFVLERDLTLARTQLTDQESANVRNAGEIQRLNEEKQALAQPSLSGSAIYAARRERDAGQQKIDVQFNSQQRSFNLVFALPPEAMQFCVVDIVSGSKILWHSETPIEGMNPTVSVHLESAFFAPGDYLLRISGKNGSAVDGITEYKLKISK